MDTVIIKIYGPSKFEIRNKALFLPELTKRRYEDLSPTEKKPARHRPYLRKFRLEAPKAERYLPRVEIFETLAEDQKSVRYILTAEFSIPKLLYGNSLQEITEKDKQKVFLYLQSALSSVGIGIEIAVIAEAKVSGVHFCKNILLPEKMRMAGILDELSKMDISKAVDVTSTQFKNGGRVLNVYSGTIDRSFYDKVSDALRPKNKRSDKNRINYERGIIEEYKLENREVFRYEYRIKKGQTIKRELNKILGRDKTTSVIFSELFTVGLHKTILIKSWKMLLERPENQLALFNSPDCLVLLTHIFSKSKTEVNNPYSMNNAFISYGLARAIKDHGAKEIKRSVFAIWNTDHPERLTRKIKKAADLASGLPFSNSIVFIDQALEKFEIITLALLENVV